MHNSSFCMIHERWRNHWPNGLWYSRSALSIILPLAGSCLSATGLGPGKFLDFDWFAPPQQVTAQHGEKEGKNFTENFAVGAGLSQKGAFWCHFSLRNDQTIARPSCTFRTGGLHYIWFAWNAVAVLVFPTSNSSCFDGTTLVSQSNFLVLCEKKGIIDIIHMLRFL